MIYSNIFMIYDTLNKLQYSIHGMIYAIKYIYYIYDLYDMIQNIAYDMIHDI